MGIEKKRGEEEKIESDRKRERAGEGSPLLLSLCALVCIRIPSVHTHAGIVQHRQHHTNGPLGRHFLQLVRDLLRNQLRERERAREKERKRKLLSQNYY
jgi:hypothetical protein